MLCKASNLWLLYILIFSAITIIYFNITPQSTPVVIMLGTWDIIILLC